MTGYRYDEDVRERVTRLLFDALPAFYRVRDEQGADPEALYRFLRVLGAPAALLRQNIEELHADLFIDTGHDHVIPLLADMVGTTLVFPDAAANRRDVRGTVGFRRRKGSLQMLQEMGAELTAQLVVAQEGWKRLQLAQNLNLLRPERTTPDLRPALVAEQAHGPLDALFHAVDLRAISAQTGRHHPKHVVHWIHPTLTFPLRRVTSVSESLPGSDQRFAMHPLGAWLPLRARATPERALRTDRIPELHFATKPADWFGVDGRFSIEICGLAAAVPEIVPVQRTARVELADQELVRGAVALTLVDHDSRAWQGRMIVEVGTAPFSAAGPGAWIANVAAFIPRATVELDGSGVVSSSQNPGPSTNRVVLLRVRPPAGIGGRFFPGATFEIAGGQPAAHAAARDAELAREGFVRGALHVTVPRLHVIAERFLFVAADGSVYDAHETPSGPANAPMPESGGQRVLSPRRLLVHGPGPAFPPTPASADPTFVTRLPSAPGRGPAVMHGGVPVLRVGSDLAAVPPVTECALSFAIRVDDVTSTRYRPFLRLTWTGSDPSTAVWSALDVDGLPVPGDPARVSAEYAAVAELREQGRGSFPLAVRFECSRADGSLTPAEVAFTTDDGRTLLIHLPELAASAAAPEPWPRDTSRFPAASRPVRVAADGSTWSALSSANERQSTGAIAPVSSAVALRRRRVHWRRLCAWQNEDWTALPPRTLALTRPGSLDVDVAHGLFAMAADEAVQRWPADALGERPASVTASFEEGATMHLGARPDAREPVLDQRLAQPTRIVSGSGHLSANAPAAWHALPRYATLTEALAAISSAWSSLTPAAIDRFAEIETFTRDEVIQIEDSATYFEAPVWPAAPADPAVTAKARFSLTLQAAERERPHLLVDPALGFELPASPARFEQLTLLGIALGGAGWAGMRLPRAHELRIALCSVLYPENRLSFDTDERSSVRLERSELAGLELLGPGSVLVSDSIIDSVADLAIAADAGQARLERVTVGGEVAVRELHASEVLFDDRVVVTDRFRGCVRFSRVTEDSVLPRAHRCVFGVRVAYVTLDRQDPAWRRLRADADPRILRGAENGAELGAFGSLRHAEKIAAFELRQREYTPAGLVSGIVRLD